MAVLQIIKSGPLCSVQDGGRPGHRSSGIGQSGAMDALSLRIGNLLVGNPPHAAALEIALGNTEFGFTASGWVALTGSETQARLDGRNLAWGWCEEVHPGSHLQISAPRPGQRIYLAVAGGINTPLWLGSRSTDLHAGWSGPLTAGDELPLGVEHRPCRRRGVALPQPRTCLRALPGPDVAGFVEEQLTEFWSQPWRITAQSNRMGLRLQGPALRYRGKELLSHAVWPGTVQVPPDGQPIILGAEAQATGGYPRVALICSADLWCLGQLPLGGNLQFSAISVADARLAARRQLRYLAYLAQQLNLTDE